MPITLRASTCPRSFPENLLGGNCKFVAGVNNPMGKNWARSSLLESRGDSGEGQNSCQEQLQ